MKFVIILAVLASAAAYYEPEDSELYPCHCRGKGDPIIQTYDNAVILLEEQQKTLLSRWDRVRRDPCKFEFHSVTREDYYGETGNLYIDWIGFSFDVHKNPKKFDRNVILGQNLEYIAQRGRGFRKPTLAHVPYYYYENNHNMTVYVNNTDASLRLISHSCPYKLIFYPRIRNTWFDFFVGSRYMDGHLVGLCGDCNLNKDDDMKTCPNDDGEGYVVYHSNKFTAMVLSCKSGTHQGDYFAGAKRIDMEYISVTTEHWHEAAEDYY